MEFYVNQSVCKNHLFSPSCFTDGHEAESTFGMVKRRFAPWRLYSSAECTSLMKHPDDGPNQPIYQGQNNTETTLAKMTQVENELDSYINREIMRIARGLTRNTWGPSNF